MSVGKQIKMVILFEGELRTAARALHRAHTLEESDAEEDVVFAAYSEAVNACLIALHGLHDDTAVAMLAADAIRPGPST